MPSFGALSTLLSDQGLLVLIVALWAGLVLTLAAWTLLLEKQTSRKQAIGFGLTLVAAAIIVPLAIRQYPFGWIAGVVVVATGLGLAVPFLKHKALRPLRLSGLISMLAIGIALSASLGTEYLQRKDQAGEATLATTRALLSTAAERSLAASRELSELPTARDILSAEQSRRGELSASLLQDMRKKELDFLTIIDDTGTVITRAHQPNSYSGSPLQEAPWAASVFSDNQSVGGRAIIDDGQPSIVGASPIQIDGITRGVIIVGVRIQETLLTNAATGGGIAVATDRGITSYAADAALARTMYQSAVIDELIREDLADNTKTTLRYILTVDTARYAVDGQILSTLSGGSPLALLAATIQPEPYIHPVAAGLIGALVGILISMLLYRVQWVTLGMYALSKWKKTGGANA